MALKKVAIIGRPNVGKSTLFNRLTGKKLALVDDQPGVTRDWRMFEASLGDLRFTLFDTAGLEGFEASELSAQIQEQTRKIIDQSDLILFMVDARDGILSSDQSLAQLLRESKKPVIFLANKSDTKEGKEGLSECYTLGMGEPLAFSGAHGLGLGELYDQVQGHIPSGAELDEEAPKDENKIQLAIVGRPNVGKSTLVNQLLGEKRVLTGNQPGITRDAIGIDWTYKGQAFRLVDTAGVRRKSKVEDDLEKASLQDSLRAIQYAQVTVLVVDATSPLDKQELILASRVIEEGRALVLAINKWDLVSPDILGDIQHRLGSALSQVRDIPCVPMSALKGKNLDALMKRVTEIYKLWNVRLSTSQLNQWLEETLTRHPPPLSSGRRIKIKYMTQIKTRPPTYALFVNKGGELPASYLRFLMNALRDDFGLPGVPLRFHLRKGKNPYV